MRPADRGRLLGMAGLALAATWIAFLSWNLTLLPYGRDQAIYAVVADTILEGGAPYRDAWDFKPPGIYFVYALAEWAFGDSEGAIRRLEVLGLLSAMAAFGILSNRWLPDPRAAVASSVVAVTSYLSLDFWHTGQPEGFGGMLILWAIVCAVEEPSPRCARGRLAAWAMSGALYAFAGLLKPPLAGGAAVSAFFLYRDRRRAGAGVKRAWVPASAMALGGLALLGIMALFFWVRGALGDLAEALFVFAPTYTALGVSTGRLPELVLRTLRTWLFDESLLGIIGLALLLLSRPRSGTLRGSLHVGGVLAVTLLGVAIQGKLFAYHFAASILLTSLLAGWGYGALFDRARRSIVFGVLLVATIAIPSIRAETLRARSMARIEAWLHPEREPAIFDALYRLPDFRAAANRMAAEWIRENTGPGDSIYVWGFEPGIYDLADRRPATRYIYNVPQRLLWAGRDAARDELMTDLRTDPPAVVVVQSNDVLPWVTGEKLGSNAALSRFAPLLEWLESSYRPSSRVGHLSLLRRIRGGGDP